MVCQVSKASAEGPRFSRTARDVIRKEYGDSRNFMTPDVESFGWIRRHGAWALAFELSSGTGIGSGFLFGVSVVRQYPDGKTERDLPLSRVFSSRWEAMGWIHRLQNKVRGSAS